jgi:hypothetical protein
MGKGIGTVVSANKSGGFYQPTGNEHLFGLLQTALGSGDSANPFQDPGLGEWMIFDPLNMETFAPVQDKIREIFDDFTRQELASLQERPDNLKVIETDEAEAAILVYATNLETGSPFEASVTGTSNGLVVTLLG